MTAKTVKRLIFYSGVYVTLLFLLLTIEFFVTRNGVSALIGSQTAFWWFGGILVIVSVFATAYFGFNLTMWFHDKVEKELHVDQD